MAIFTVTSGRKTLKDTTAADTYNIAADATRVTIAGGLKAGDVIHLEGLASEYEVRASGRTITLKSETQTVVFQLAAANGSASVRFLDGDLTASWGGAKVGAKLGTQKLTAKLAAVNDDKLGTTDSTAVDFTGTTGTGTGTGTGTTTTGSSFALTTGVDGVSGSSGNDTISGVLGTSGTFTVGDDVAGGAGTDTLKLVVASGSDGDVGLAALGGVEIVTVRSVGTAYASAGDEVAINATDWSGVSVISNASSIANTRLDVSGVDLSTTIVLNGNTDMQVGFRNTTTATSAISVQLVNAGSAGTATTVASASATNTANLILDEASADLITAVSINVSGAVNLARIDAGSAVTTYTIGGDGNASIVTDDTITSFNASAAKGSIDATFSGNSDLSVVGGAGNDSFNFGTTFNNLDSIDGGSGIDTLAMTIDTVNRSINATNIEALSLSFNAAAPGTVNLSAMPSVLTIDVAAASNASADVNLAAVGSGATIRLNEADIEQVTLDYASVSVATVQIGSATGSVEISGIDITDATTVNFVAVSGSAAATFTWGTATVDADAKAVNVTNGGDADVLFDALHGNAATAFTITNSGSGDITLTSGIEAGTALVSININAYGGTGGDVTVADIGAESGSAVRFVSLAVSAAGGSDVVFGSAIFGDGATGAMSIAVKLNAGTDSIAGSTAGGSDLTVSGDDAIAINISAAASGTVALGTIEAGSGAPSAGSVVTVDAFNAGAGATVKIEQINLLGTGGQLVLGSIVAGQDSDVRIGASGGIVTDEDNVDLQSVEVSVGKSAYFSLGSGTIDLMDTATAGAVGSINVTVLGAGTAVIGAISASAVGNLAFQVSALGGIDVGNIFAAQTVGTITISGDTAGDVTFAGKISASAIGNISIEGALDVNLGALEGEVGTINLSNHKVGTITIDLSSADNAFEIYGGAGTNNITTTDNAQALITLASATGTDTIEYESAGANYDEIYKFEAGAGGDVIRFDVSEILLGAGASGIRDAGGSAVAAAGDITFATANSTAAFTMDGEANIIMMTGTWSGTADVASALQSWASFATAVAASAEMLVVWTNANDGDAYISQVLVGTAGATTFASATTVSITNQTFAKIDGVSAGAFTTANFAFI